MDKFDYLKYTAKVTTLSPLHIGTGRELMQDYDYAVDGGKTWRLNEGAFLEAQNAEDPAVMQRLMSTPPAQLLRTQDFKEESEYFRYVISGEPRSQKMREQIKTTDDKPYIPGSSLKGALRTAILWRAWQYKGLSPDIDQITESRRRDGSRKLRDKSFAAEPFERDIAGRKPANAEGSDANYDLMRALQVSDGQGNPSNRLEVVRAAVFRTNGRIDKFTDLEAIARDAEFIHKLKIDTALFSDWAKRHGLMLANDDPRAGGWLKSLVEICREYTSVRIQSEVDYFSKANPKQANKLIDIYGKFNRLKSQLKKERFWLQLGWGSGWNGKTFGTNLRQSDEFMNEIITGYNLGGHRHKYAHPSLFPVSRRLKMSDDNQPVLPLGWVLVELTETS